MGIYRQDVYEIPPDAIRELIINAMVHRSYLDHGTIQITVYNNRLKITSPGKLPMGQTMERMKEGYSKIFNKYHWERSVVKRTDEIAENTLEVILY